jgi:hypothetical protein
MIIQTISTILIIAMSGNTISNYVLDRDNIIDANQTSLAKLDVPMTRLTDALKTLMTQDSVKEKSKVMLELKESLERAIYAFDVLAGTFSPKLDISKILTEYKTNEIYDTGRQVDFTNVEYLENINKIEIEQGKIKTLEVMIEDVWNSGDILREAKYISNIENIYNKIDSLVIEFIINLSPAFYRELDRFMADGINLATINPIQISDKNRDNFVMYRNIHFTRILLNREPESLGELEKNKYEINKVTYKAMPFFANYYHMMGSNAAGNKKYVSDDGRFEAIFTDRGKLLSYKNDQMNMGTYNYAPAMSDKEKIKSMHSPCDVKPYQYFGNFIGGLGKPSSNDYIVSTINLLSNINIMTIGKHIINWINGKEYSVFSF